MKGKVFNAQEVQAIMSSDCTKKLEEVIEMQQTFIAEVKNEIALITGLPDKYGLYGEIVEWNISAERALEAVNKMEKKLKQLLNGGN